MRAGQLLAGRYRLVEQIGSGGMGVVWRATDEQLDREVALKRLYSKGDERAFRVMRREAKLAAGVHHPNIVTVFDIVLDDGDACLIMEYVPSSSLAERGSMAPEAAAVLGVQVADALRAVHAAGVVHGDVKPGNLLITEDGTVKLADFGVSRMVEAEATLTDTGLVRGTPAYLAPEVANGGDLTPASDMFSLGATLFAAVEGVSPYGESTNPLQLIRRAASNTITPSRNAGPLTPVLTRLLARDPDRRPDAATARQLLLGVSAGDQPVAQGKRWWVVAAAALAVVTVGVVIALDRNTVTPSAPQATTQVIGDPRTADPCALNDSAVLGRYGQAKLTRHYGNFDRCDVVVRTTNGGLMVDVAVMLQNPAPPPEGDVTRVGTVNVVKQPGDSGECDRILLLPDQYQVDVSAKLNDPGQVDLCGMADTAANSAVAVIGRGPLARRTLPTASLANTDACALLDATALARIPGVHAADHRSTFGSWECRWHSSATNTDVILKFDQDQSRTTPDGRPEQLGGHLAFVQPGGDGGQDCRVLVEYRTYSDDTSEPTVERLSLVVSGQQPPADLCVPATDLANAAAAKLPKP